MDKDLSLYLDQITECCLDEAIIINGKRYWVRKGDKLIEKGVKGINAAFIEKQSIEWLHSFYKWLSATSRKMELIKQKPVFLDQNKKATAAYDNSGRPVLFLPAENIQECRTVCPELLENTEDKIF